VTTNDLPNKEYLYGRYNDQEDWRTRLHRRLTHKSLDIPETDDVYVDNSKRGLGWKELAVIAATGLGGAGLYSLSQSSTAPVPPVSNVQPQLLDSEYEVRFFDAEGKPINVPHISQLKTDD